MIKPGYVLVGEINRIHIHTVCVLHALFSLFIYMFHLFPGKGRPVPRGALVARPLHFRRVRLSSVPNNPVYTTRLDPPCDSHP